MSEFLINDELVLVSMAPKVSGHRRPYNDMKMPATGGFYRPIAFVCYYSSYLISGFPSGNRYHVRIDYSLLFIAIICGPLSGQYSTIYNHPAQELTGFNHVAEDRSQVLDVVYGVWALLLWLVHKIEKICVFV